MCGIAGIVDLSGQRSAPPGTARRMADVMVHRGPDEDGYLDRHGLNLSMRRLSIVGLADGQQPISNEDGSIWVVFNGELFDYPEKKAFLESKGHVFRTHTDTELIPHLYEEYGEGMFAHLKGQFAICVWDTKKNIMILARDRVGICPLFYTIRKPAAGPGAGTEWLLFASEIKCLLASGFVPAKVDLQGINQVFSFFAVPGPMTCFEGVRLLTPGHYLRVQIGAGSADSCIQDRTYWEIDFPDHGQEEQKPHDVAVREFDELFRAAVDRRLRADVPVVSYLSGGVDSSTVVAVASDVLKRPIPTFTISVQAKGLNEENEAAIVARHVGTKSIIVPYGDSDVRTSYPELIRAAEVPVVDTSCAALMMLAKSVRQNGYKVALTGEGADEFMAGYSWFKTHKLLSVFGQSFGMFLRQMGLRVSGSPRFPQEQIRATQDAVGGHNGWIDLYGMMSLSKLRFYREDLRNTLAIESPFTKLGLNSERVKKWHPFNRSIYVGCRVMLPGHLLCSKGDRVAMNSSVEVRYPFLDEDLIAYLLKIDPKWKLHGLRDKYILRNMASRWLPKEIAWRRKVMFRAPLDSFHMSGPETPAWIDQVLSPESLKKTGLFDADAVSKWRKDLPNMRRMLTRTSIELGLVAVTATQLWHHLYISGELADLPSPVRDNHGAPAESATPWAAAG
jgi:asparagine synthase (glutamine-hydrolysing)